MNTFNAGLDNRLNSVFDGFVLSEGVILVAAPHSVISYLLLQYSVLRGIEISLVPYELSSPEFELIARDYCPTIIVKSVSPAGDEPEDFLDAVIRGSRLNNSRGRGYRDQRSAYVLYSSGSTGSPKGIAISRHNLVSFFSSMDSITQNLEGIECAVSPFAPSFDFNIGSYLYPLFRGKMVAIPPTDGVLFWLVDQLTKVRNKSLVCLVPTMAVALIEFLRERRKNDDRR